MARVAVLVLLERHPRSLVCWFSRQRKNNFNRLPGDTEPRKGKLFDGDKEAAEGIAFSS